MKDAEIALKAKQEVLEEIFLELPIIEKTLKDKKELLKKIEESIEQADVSIKALVDEYPQTYGKQKTNLKYKINYANHSKIVALNLFNRMLTSICTLEKQKMRMKLCSSRCAKEGVTLPENPLESVPQEKI